MHLGCVAMCLAAHRVQPPRPSSVWRPRQPCILPFRRGPQLSRRTHEKNGTAGRRLSSSKVAASSSAPPVVIEDDDDMAASDGNFGAAGGGYLEVEGGARLEGIARVSGAKNAVLALLAGTLACREPVTLHSVPLLKDVLSMLDVLRSVGVTVHVGAAGPGSVTIDAGRLSSASPDKAAVQALRASFFAAGPILARTGEVHMPLPGGCDIGARPVDLHLQGFEALGAEVNVTPDGVVHAVATGPGGRLQGAGRIRLRFPSVGATHAIVMAAALADGDTVLENAAAEPEVADLAAMLNAAGARISGAGTSVVTIQGIGGSNPTGGTTGNGSGIANGSGSGSEGWSGSKGGSEGEGRDGDGSGWRSTTGDGDVSGLRGCVHVAIPDRIEAGTMLVAAACTGSPLTLSPVLPAHLEATVGVLRAAGCEVETVGRAKNALSRPNDSGSAVGGFGGGGGGITSSLSYYDGLVGEELRITPPRGIGGGSRGLNGGGGGGLEGVLRSVNFTTEPHPGVPTDMQPQLCVMLAMAEGESRVRETVFENRFSHIPELAKMGCDVRLDEAIPSSSSGMMNGKNGKEKGHPREAVIRGSGGAPLIGADVCGSDLRASAALVLAGLAARDGDATRVEGLRHLDRGYEGLDDKLVGLGAKIRRVPM